MGNRTGFGVLAGNERIPAPILRQKNSLANLVAMEMNPADIRKYAYCELLDQSHHSTAPKCSLEILDDLCMLPGSASTDLESNGGYDKISQMSTRTGGNKNLIMTHDMDNRKRDLCLKSSQLLWRLIC